MTRRRRLVRAYRFHRLVTGFCGRRNGRLRSLRFAIFDVLHNAD